MLIHDAIHSLRDLCVLRRPSIRQCASHEEVTPLLGRVADQYGMGIFNVPARPGLVLPLQDQNPNGLA